MATPGTGAIPSDLKPITLSGGMRKDKRIRPVIKKTIPDTYKIGPIIDELNKKLIRMEQSKFYQYLNSIMEILIKSLTKTHFIEKDIYKEYREQKKIYIMKHLFETRDESIVLIEKCYEWVNTTFHPQGIRMLNTFIENINRDLQIKTREGESGLSMPKEMIKFERTRFNSGLEYLGLSTDDKISYRQIREEYELRKNLIGSSENSEMDILNEHFVYLRDFYNDYLNEILEKPRED